MGSRLYKGVYARITAVEGAVTQRAEKPLRALRYTGLQPLIELRISSPGDPRTVIREQTIASLARASNRSLNVA